ncbi:MAG: DUF87 domain-containing protein [Desulfurococcales archaeon]|nr:DUF87 domain-containing protein [Desulfurococcales archaeon]
MWRIKPSPYEDMPESVRDILVNGLKAYLASISKPVLMSMYSMVGSYRIDDDEITYVTPVFIVDGEDPRAAGLDAVEADSTPPRPRALRQRGRTLILDDGGYARLTIIGRLPGSLPEAFLALGGLVSEIHVYVEPVRSVRSLLLRARRLRQAGHPDWEMLDAILGEATGGHRPLIVRVMLIVRSSDREELERMHSRIVAYLAGLGVQYQVPFTGQVALYNKPRRLGMARGVVLTTAAVHVLYFFVAEELMEENGIPLGVNARTGAPVVVNPYNRANYNIVILGESGSGKSMTTKLYVRRWRTRYEGPVYIIDPSGEYARVAELLDPNLRVHTVSPDRGGLDPVRLYRIGMLTYTQAYEILASVYGVTEREEKLTLMEQLENAENVLDVRVLGETKLDAGLFIGEPPGLDSNGAGVVFDLSRLATSRHKVLAGSILAALLRNRLRRRSLLVVDEGWLWGQYPELMALLAEVARVGRKYGVNFLFATQRPSDVLRNEAGRTILEQSATVLLLHLNEASVEAIRDIYMLTEGETQRLLEARPGEGVLRVENWRLSVYVKPSRRELEAFSTKPGEWQPL